MIPTQRNQSGAAMETIVASPVHRLAHGALSRLARDRAMAAAITAPSGQRFELSYRGPGIPQALPDGIADFEAVRLQDPAWIGTHRLVVRVPLVVLDVCWNEGEPVRIMVFCRGDWEDDLLEATA